MQVPQFVLEDAEMRGVGSDVHIVVTQPRRIAAIRYFSFVSYGFILRLMFKLVNLQAVLTFTFSLRS